MAPPDPPPRRGWVKPVLTWAVVAVLAVLLFRVLRDVTWSQVGDALGRLVWWQAAVLLLLIAVRQTLSAGPLALFVPGLGLGRSVVNDLSATLVATAAPSPSDIVLRVSMFRAWQVDPSAGLLGLVLNSLCYYVVRFVAPVAGFLLLWAVEDLDPTLATAALSSGVAALAVLLGIVLATRSRTSARALGRWGANVLRWVRPASEAGERWPDRLAEFQEDASGLVARRSGWVALDLLALLVVESLILLAAARFVGVDAASAGAFLLVACFLCAYPLTALPFLGLGVFDAAVVALVTERSAADPDLLVAAMVLWRIAVQLVPLAAGAVSLLVWRRTHPAPDDSATTDPDPDREA